MINICTTSLKAIISGKRFISARRDFNRILNFVFLWQNNPNLPTLLGLEILPTHFVKITINFKKVGVRYTPTPRSERPCSYRSQFKGVYHLDSMFWLYLHKNYNLKNPFLSVWCGSRIWNLTDKKIRFQKKKKLSPNAIFNHELNNSKLISKMTKSRSSQLG